MIKHAIKLGVMAASPCNYLPLEKESIAIVMDDDVLSSDGYNALVQAGFRRSGNNIYRPHCGACTACHSLRVSVEHFQPSKSQKRQLNQLKRLDLQLKDALDDNWFELYDRYISARHRDGSMYPARKDDFLSFVQSDWLTVRYLHVYDQGRLIAIAVTDDVDAGYSAIYSFFDPDHSWSLGSLCVLAQLTLASENQKPWLYLGFQIDACSAMSYKEKFKPNQRYIAGEWVSFEK